MGQLDAVGTRRAVRKLPLPGRSAAAVLHLPLIHPRPALASASERESEPASALDLALSPASPLTPRSPHEAVHCRPLRPRVRDGRLRRPAGRPRGPRPGGPSGGRAAGGATAGCRHHRGVSADPGPVHMEPVRPDPALLPPPGLLQLGLSQRLVGGHLPEPRCHGRLPVRQQDLDRQLGDGARRDGPPRLRHREPGRRRLAHRTGGERRRDRGRRGPRRRHARRPETRLDHGRRHRRPLDPARPDRQVPLLLLLPGQRGHRRPHPPRSDQQDQVLLLHRPGAGAGLGDETVIGRVGTLDSGPQQAC